MSLPPPQPNSPGSRLPLPRWVQIGLLPALIAVILLVGLPLASGRWQRSAPETPAPVHLPDGIQLPAPPMPTPAPDSLSAIPLDPLAHDQALPFLAGAEPQTIISQELIATELLSITGDRQAADRPITGIALSADAGIVAFATRAGNLASQAVNPGDQPATGSAPTAYEQIYVLDRTLGILELITLGVDGAPGNGWSSAPALSPDGRFVAFYSWATNLVAGDTNAVQDAFVYDRRRGEMSRVSVSTDGRQGNDRSGDSRAGVRPALSADGRFIAFHSAATNLVDEPVSGVQVYLHDRQTGATELLSAGSTGAAGNGDSQQPALSADGSRVAFQSRATNLGTLAVAQNDEPLPPHAGWQIWLLDRTQANWTLLSHAQTSPRADAGPAFTGPMFADGDSTWPALDGPGQSIAFQSTATNLATSQGSANPNRTAHIYVFDTETANLRRVSVSSMGIPGNRDSTTPAFAHDGRYIAFVSAATNLVSGDTNEAADVFLHDLQTHHTGRVSVGVAGEWLGVEADGPALGPPALNAGGTAVAFIAHATTLLPVSLQSSATAAPDFPAQAFIHTRRPPPAYAVGGRITDINGQPIAQVLVRAGPHRTQTDAAGLFELPNLVAGTYTVVAEHSRFSFAPPRRILSVLRPTVAIDFTGYAGIDPGQAFLDLPFAYDGSVATFLQALRDTSEGGLVDAWFDHAYPDYIKTGSMRLWDGRLRDTEPYNQELGCYQRRCYDGHDGTDFPYRAHLIDTAQGAPNIPILPAAPGRVVHRVDHCPQAGIQCNQGYGNEVILYHENGYFTRYSHLARVDAAPQSFVTRATPLGLMGSTGNSYGIHLHFGVHRDDGNGQWDGGSVDRPVDPFGWAGSEPDPWVADRGGPVSRWLWLYHPTAESGIVGSAGGTLRDVAGNIRLILPPDAFSGQARFELAPAPPEGPLPAGMRSVGRTFWVRLLDLLDTGSPQPLEMWRPAQPLTLEVDLSPLDLRHLDADALAIRRWNATDQRWHSLPTAWNAQSGIARAETDRLGNFDIQAPMLCPQDHWEPDDSYFAAVPLPANGAPIRRLLDVAADEDWFRIETATGRAYRATLEDLGTDVFAELTLFDADGISALESLVVDAPRAAMRLGWTTEGLQPNMPHVVFLRVRPLSHSTTGCHAAYTLRVEPEP